MRDSTQLKPLVSIVIPCHNEGSGIDELYQGLTEVLDSIAQASFEIICVDDGSTDDTLAKLLGVVARDRRFRVLELSRNFGKEAALTAGLEASSGDAVVPMDADLQDPPQLLAPMIEAWRAGAEVVLARRVDRRTDSYLKRKTASLFYQLHNQLSQIRIPQDVGDYRLMDRVVVDALARLPESQRFMKGLFAWVGYRTVAVDYSRPSRTVGDTKFSGWALWNLAIEGFTSFSTAPLRVWTYVGATGAMFTFLYATFIVIRTIIYGRDVPGYASLLVAVLFLGSLQLISIGLLGEYIGRIYTESKGRPTYLVRQSYGESGRESL